MKIVKSRNYNLHVRLHRALREFPRYNNFLVQAHNLPLGLLQAHILVELSCNFGINVKDLSIILGIEMHQLSKMLARMQKDQLLFFRNNPLDLRIKNIYLTKNGISLLEKFDLSANDQLRKFEKYSKLFGSDNKKIATILNRLADGLQAPPSHTREHEHPIRASIRRLTRSFGLLGRRTLKSELNALEWQLLLTVCEYSKQFNFSELGCLLGIHKVTLSKAIKRLLQLKLLTKVSDKYDKRSYYLIANNEGYKLVNKIEQTTAEQFFQAIKLKESEVQLVERWIRGAAMHFFLDQQGLSIRQLSSQQDFLLVRKCTLMAYDLNNCQFLPGELYSENNLVFGLFKSSQLVSAVELKKTADMSGLILVNAYVRDGTQPDSIRSFLLTLCSPELKVKPKIQKLPHINIELAPQNSITTTLGGLF